ncbi:hypothetical protein D3C71_1485330 [compost metagenome]
MVDKASSTPWVLVCASDVPRIGTMNGFALVSTCRQQPLATRRMVFTAIGLSRKIVRPRLLQSMHSAAVRQGCCFAVGTLWRVGAGQTIGFPSLRATRYRRFRIVGALAFAAMRSRHSTL